MKKYILLLLMIIATTYAGYAEDCHPVCSIPYASPCKPFGKYQIGIAHEETSSKGTIYGYLSGLIKDHYFFELRGYGILNFITANPPTAGFPVIVDPINNREQKNLYGTGFVSIFGYTLQLPSGMKGSLTPYFRYEARKNNSGPLYQDSRGNKVTSWGYGYFCGLRLSMPVTEDFNWAVQYYGGFIRVDLKGQGFFAQSTTNTLPRPSYRNSHYNTLQGNLQFSMAYNLSKDWTVAAWWKITITNNNPSRRITDAPSPYSDRITRLTSTSYQWGARLGFNF